MIGGRVTARTYPTTLRPRDEHGRWLPGPLASANGKPLPTPPSPRKERQSTTALPHTRGVASARAQAEGGKPQPTGSE